MKALMVNVTPAVAAGIYSGKKYVPVRQIPNLGGAKDVTVYICEGEKVTGTAKYVGPRPRRKLSKAPWKIFTTCLWLGSWLMHRSTPKQRALQKRV